MIRRVRRKAGAAALAAIGLLMAGVLPAGAAPGDPDTTFSGATTPVGSTSA